MTRKPRRDEPVEAMGGDAAEDAVGDAAVGGDEERLGRIVHAVADRDLLARVCDRGPRGS
jgi:hypothetical protein